MKYRYDSINILFSDLPMIIITGKNKLPDIFEHIEIIFIPQ